MAKKNKPKVKAVLFDAGGILFDDRRKNFFRDFIREHAGEEAISHSFRVFKKYKGRAQTSKTYDMDKAYYDCMEKVGIANLYPQLMEIAEEDKRKPLKLTSHTNKVLEGLSSRGIRSIIVTDNYYGADDFLSKLYNAGMRQIDDIVSSKDVGARKPSSKIFELALKKNGLKKEEVLFVAHDLDEIRGASKLGYKTAAVYWKNKEEPGIRKYATYLMSDLDRLLEVVDGR